MRIAEKLKGLIKHKKRIVCPNPKKPANVQSCIIIDQLYIIKIRGVTF